MAEPSPRIMQAIEDFFNTRRMKFTISGDAFYIEANVEGRLKTVDIFVHVSESSFVANFYLPLKTTDDVGKLRMAEFIARANSEMNDGCFELDFDSGDIRFRMSHFCGTDEEPIFEVIEHTIFEGLKEIVWYSDALFKVLRGAASPKDALDSLYI